MADICEVLVVSRAELWRIQTLSLSLQGLECGCGTWDECPIIQYAPFIKLAW
jgi:hypothetical protein